MQSLLTDTSYIEDLWDIRGETKRFLSRNSVPFYIPSVAWSPRTAIVKLNEGFQQRHERFFDVVEDLVAHKDELRDAFRDKYPNLYRPDKYPNEHALRARFKFEWVFRHFNPPAQELSVLPPDLYQQELEKWQREARGIRDGIIGSIGGAFMSKIDSLRKQCFNGTINAGTLRSLHEFFERFGELWDGFIGHDQLKAKIAEARLYLDGTDAPMLNSDTDFRNLVGDKMFDIMSDINDSGDARLHRSLDL
jgi:hypothetical protein